MFIENSETIKLPEDFFEDKKSARSNSFKDLNECYKMYRQRFRIFPNEIIFNGDLGKKIYDLIHDIFDGAYLCSFNVEWCNSVILKNNKTLTISKKDYHGDPFENAEFEMPDMFNKPISGNLSDIAYQLNMMTINTNPEHYIIDKSIDTSIEFMIIQDKTYDPVPTFNALNLFV